MQARPSLLGCILLVVERDIDGVGGCGEGSGFWAGEMWGTLLGAI